METKQNMYLLKALDAYPYELQEAMEALEYALSYEPENAEALFLMGRFYSEQLQDFETAKYYYDAALAQNLAMPRVYVYYAQLLINNEDYPQAKRLLEFAKTQKGVDRAYLCYLEGLIMEYEAEFKQAKKAYKLAKKLSVSNNFRSQVDNEIARVKDKQPKVKTKTKKKKKRKNKKKKSNK